MTNILRILLGTLAIAAPWWCGAVTAQSHFYLGAVLVGIALLRWGQQLFLANGSRSAGIPLLLFVLLGFLLIGVSQISPSGDSHPLLGMKSAPLSDLAPGLVASPDLSHPARGLQTFSPQITLLTLSQLTLAVLAFWLGFELFEDAASRRWLYWALAVNGLAITGFGIAQQLTWNGQLFWMIPLRFGGSPFGPFVNRNNGAGYLLLTFACAVSSFVIAWTPYGLGPKLARGGPSRATSSERLVGVLARLTPEVLLSGVAVVGIAIGVLMSMSRAGVAGLLAAGLILIPALRLWESRRGVLVLAFAGLAVSGVIWLGQSEQIVKRLGSLASLPQAFEGRVEHWQEVMSLVGDDPWTGSGWGTYGLVNPVYLSRNHDAWFQHAENQYLEILVEAGVGGLGLFVMAWLLLAIAAGSSVRRDQAGRQLASGICGLLTVASLSVISLTDFSLSIGSILLTLALVGGTVYASHSRLDSVSSWILIARHQPNWRVVVGAMLLVAAGWAIMPLRTAADVEACLARIPPDGPTPRLEVAECDNILSQLQSLGQRDPEQPDIAAATGQLRITRYRRMLFDELLQAEPNATAMRRRILWSSTHLERLDAVCTGLRINGDKQSERQLLSRREIAENLPAALTDLDRCVQLNPLQRGVAMPRAWLSHILQRPSIREARDLAMFVGTSDAEIQFQAGQLSQRLDQPDAADRCWKRCLELSDVWSVWVWNEATQTRDELETLALFPYRLEPLMQIAASPRSLAVRQEILERCRKMASADAKLPVLTHARLHVQLDDLPQASEAYLQAMRETPYDIGLRMEATEILVRAGHHEQACAVLGVAHNLAPGRSDVTARFESLIRQKQGSVENTHGQE